MNHSTNQPLRANQHVERVLVTSILDGTFPSGSALPNERSLAEQIGVTRPTLRETLQRLANEGWIKIHHGKSTIVNDYWQEGGLSLLSTLAQYGDYLPNGFISHLLEVRVALLPAVARLAAAYHPQRILDYLNQAPNPSGEAGTFAMYDWSLQMLMARNSKNPIFPLILNDFALIFKTMALSYFNQKKACLASLAYYQQLSWAIDKGGKAVEVIVKKAMEQSIKIWQEVKSQSGQAETEKNLSITKARKY